MTADDEALLGPEDEPEAQPAEAPRWINADIEKHAKSTPLTKGKTYTLAFDVDVTPREESDVSVILDLSVPKGVKHVDLTVELWSKDFTIPEREKTLRVKRSGPSANKARFKITPLRDGEGKIEAIFHKQGNFVQRMTLTIQVGTVSATHTPPVVTSTSIGRPVTAAATLQPRKITLMVEKTGDRYFLRLLGTGGTEPVRLAPNKDQLALRLEEVRKTLLDIVRQLDATGAKVYQRGIDIDAQSNEVALRKLARVGHRLYTDLFFHPGASETAEAVGKILRERLRGPRKKVQIDGTEAPIPWGILYLADTWDEAQPVDPELFVGLRHLVEQIPLVNLINFPTDDIASDKLSITLCVNRSIDVKLKKPYVEDQIAYWKAVAGGKLKPVVHETGEALRKALAAESSDDGLLYCYCHAETVGLSDPGGPNASRLILDGQAGLVLQQLYDNAGNMGTFRNGPLVVINACESAELSPLFYDGFVPYFLRKGARGAIGTECKTPALFAAEWAKRFFDLLLQGVPIGESVYRVRREFYDKHRNILGLLYSVYCDGDACIAPPLVA